jgi:TniB protein
MILDALSKIEIRILALDEVNFTEAGTAAKQKRFLNALRYLANELRISIVCLGTEEMMRVIRSVPSVENRFAPTVLPQWRADQEFRKLLASFERIIPLQHPSDLQSRTLSDKLLARSRAPSANSRCFSPPRPNMRCAMERSASPKRSSTDAPMRHHRPESSGWPLGDTQPSKFPPS